MLQADATTNVMLTFCDTKFQTRSNKNARHCLHKQLNMVSMLVKSPWHYKVRDMHAFLKYRLHRFSFCVVNISPLYVYFIALPTEYVMSQTHSYSCTHSHICTLASVIAVSESCVMVWPVMVPVYTAYLWRQYNIASQRDWFSCYTCNNFRQNYL